MRNFLSRTDLRRLKLMEYLFFDKSPATITELSDFLRCSDRTVRQDIIEIKNEYDFLNMKSTTKGIKIDFKENYNIESLYYFIMNNNISFKLFEYLFYNHNSSVQLFSDNLYISNSTLFRLINQINPVLYRKYKLKILSNPYNLYGDETDIRYFYSQFFFDKCTILDWPFNNIDEKCLENLILYVLECVEIDIDYTRMALLKIIVAVNLTRLKNKNYIDNIVLFEEFNSIYLKISNRKDFLFKKNFFESALSIDINKDTLTELFFGFIQTNYIFSYESLLSYSNLNNKLKLSLEYLNQILDKLCTKYELIISNKDSFIIDIYNTLNLETVEAGNNYMLYDRKKRFCITTKSFFPEFYSDLEEELANWLDKIKYSYSENILNHLIYTVFTHWENLLTQFMCKIQLIEIVVISNYDLKHAKMIKNILEFHFENQANITIFKEYTISEKYLEQTKANIIVSNFQLPSMNNKKVIYIKDYPSRNNIEEISDAIYQFRLNFIKKYKKESF